MKIIITMAGFGSRFQQAGYTIPKYQINVGGHSLFYWSMLSLVDFTSKDYIFVVRSETGVENFIKSECQNLDINPYIVLLEKPTSGQAETAMLALSGIDENESIFIYNIDTYIEEGCLNESQIHGDGFIPCFYGEGEHWSFVRIDEFGVADLVKEKKRISDNCSVGAYYFKSVSLYKTLYHKYYIEQNNLELNELYIAPLYNQLIKDGGKVYICEIPSEKVHVLGTPEEVDTFNKIYMSKNE